MGGSPRTEMPRPTGPFAIPCPYVFGFSRIPVGNWDPDVRSAESEAANRLKRPAECKPHCEENRRAKSNATRSTRVFILNGRSGN